MSGSNGEPQLQQQEMFNAMRPSHDGEPVLKTISEEIDELMSLEGDEANGLRAEVGKKLRKASRQGLGIGGQAQDYLRRESKVFSIVTMGMDVISWQHAIRSDGAKLYKFAKRKWGGGAASV